MVHMRFHLHYIYLQFAQSTTHLRGYHLHENGCNLLVLLDECCWLQAVSYNRQRTSKGVATVLVWNAASQMAIAFLDLLSRLFADIRNACFFGRLLPWMIFGGDCCLHSRCCCWIGEALPASESRSILLCCPHHHDHHSR